MEWEAKQILCGGLSERGGERAPFAHPGAVDRYARDRVCDIRHIRLELDLDFRKRSLRGVASTRLAALNAGLTGVGFDAVEMAVKRVLLEGGEELTFENTGQRLEVKLPRPLQEGEEVTVRVEYETTPRRGLYFLAPDDAYPDRPVQAWTQGQDEDSRYYFPCHDYPNEKATSETIVTVPDHLFVLSNGVQADVQHDPERKTKTYHWKQETPHVTYLMSIVAGEFAEIREEVDGIPITSYVAPDREEDGRRSLENTADMMRFFSKRFGPYPYPVYAQIAVADFIFGGMENTTATTLTDFTLHDARAHLDFSSDDLVSHELAHQWWGDWVTCRDWSHAWLNEGFATYAAALYKEHRLGPEEGAYDLFQLAEEYFQEDRESYRRPVVTKRYLDPIEVFDRHIYQKGALVLHTLKTVLGEDLFWKSARHYLQKHKGGNVETLDLQRAIEEATGKVMDSFFDQWVYGPGYPEFEGEYEWKEDDGAAWLRLRQTQEEGPFLLPLVVSFEVGGAMRDVRLELTGRDQTFTIPLPEKPTMVRVDPGNGILKTLSLPLPRGLLIRQLAGDDDVVGRIRAARELVKGGSPEAVEVLGRRLQEEPFWGVQVEIARALGSIRTTSAREILGRGLQLPHPKARRAVVRALGEFQEEEAMRLLTPVVERDESYFVEAEAAKSIGRTRSPAAFDLLKENLRKDSFLDVIRVHTLEGLAALRDDRAIPLLEGVTEYGSHEKSRAAAAAALAGLADGRSDLPTIRERLVRLLDDPMLRVRSAAAVALGKLRDPKAAPALERASERDLDGRVRRQAREAIRKIREGFPGGDTLASINKEMERIREENRQLRERVDRLEGQNKS